MNTCIKNNCYQREYQPISVTYNVNTGVGRMKQHIVEPYNQRKFKRVLKVGIYKSMFHDGIINRESYMKLVGGEKECRKEK